MNAIHLPTFTVSYLQQIMRHTLQKGQCFGEDGKYLIMYTVPFALTEHLKPRFNPNQHGSGCWSPVVVAEMRTSSGHHSYTCRTNVKTWGEHCGVMEGPRPRPVRTVFGLVKRLAEVTLWLRWRVMAYLDWQAQWQLRLMKDATGKQMRVWWERTCQMEWSVNKSKLGEQHEKGTYTRYIVIRKIKATLKRTSCWVESCKTLLHLSLRHTHIKVCERICNWFDGLELLM